MILHRIYLTREVDEALMLIHKPLIVNALRAVHIVGDKTTSTLFTTTITSSAGPGRAL